MEKPFVSWYWSPKYQTSRKPMVLTTLKHTKKKVTNRWQKTHFETKQRYKAHVCCTIQVCMTKCWMQIICAVLETWLEVISYLVKQLFPGCIWLNGELQFSIHSGDSYTNLIKRERKWMTKLFFFKIHIEVLKLRTPYIKHCWSCHVYFHFSFQGVASFSHKVIKLHTTSHQMRFNFTVGKVFLFDLVVFRSV